MKRLLNLQAELGLIDKDLKAKVPRRKPRSREHELQCSCVNWFRLKYPKLRHCLFAVPNGGQRNKIVAAKLRKEGVLAGVSDLILLRMSKDYGALLIEMKDKTGKQSGLQKAWQHKIEQEGYKYVVCHSLDEFIENVSDYLED